MLVMRKQAPTKDIDAPVLRADAIAGRLVDMDVWSRNEVNCIKAIAGNMTNKRFCGRECDWFSRRGVDSSIVDELKQVKSRNSEIQN